MRKLLSLLLFTVFTLSVSAQTDTIRYVKPSASGGAYANDGRSWATAKDNIQDAINDLRTYLTQNGLHGGSVYVASGTYEPTEGVEGGQSGQLSTSFIIYEGIHVYGGFNAASPESRPGERTVTTVNRDNDYILDNLVAGDTTVVSWQMKYPTVLSGNHNHTVQGSFTWNSTRNRYDTRFPGNSYHVVWFATNGFIDDNEHPGYADTLRYTACLDGFTVQDGNASGVTDVRRGGRDHTAFGGGIYMVQGSVVDNCVVQHCQAAMRGGGIYMDGGGKVYNTLIRECQTLGSGVSGGLGGGVCIDNNGEVRSSWITRNVARMGGGAAIVSAPEDHPRGSASTYRGGLFDPFVSSTLVTNNTSTTEAGGIYLDRGGVVNHTTITRNMNAGRDISYGHTRYGRSGGVYIYGAGQVYNSVVWGNRCDANNDIQYAATTGISIPSYVALQQPFVGYTAMNNVDITDFTGTSRLNVFSFETDNNDVSRSGNFVIFQSPSSTAGAGGNVTRLTAWYPNPLTDLDKKAVQLDLGYSTQAFSVSSNARVDLFHKNFEPLSTLGAIDTDIEDIETASVEAANVSDNGGSTSLIPTLFVDPNRVVTDRTHKSGGSWDYPLNNISEAVYYFQHNTPSSGKFQILVKEGTVSCAGVGAYLDFGSTMQTQVSSATLRMLPNLLLYGGYPSSLTGTATEGRNPKDYPSRITADIISAGFDNNAEHVVSFAMAHDAVLDGFQLYYGNARNSSIETTAHGGGIVAGNMYFQSSARIDMTDNVVRNCVIANCYGTEGSAVWVGGGYAKSSGVVKASLTLENCVFHNNESPTSLIQAAGNATITMSHCTVVGNVGPVLVTSTMNGYSGSLSVTNSAFHGNSSNEQSSVNDVTYANRATLTVGNVTASSNLADSIYISLPSGFTPLFCFDSTDSLSYPSFANPVRNVGVARNTADNSVYGGTPDYTPLDMNPMVNRASYDASTNHTTWGTDLTTQITRDYGGAPDVGALECHQETDNANGGQATYGSVIYVRDYNTTDAEGNVVADTVTVNRDGTSWARAINGNATYSYNGTALIGLQYAVDMAYASTDSSKPEVWVGRGTYTNRSTTQVNRQYYAFEMREGVNVFGGFPASGSPSKNERDPKRYVSILQPQAEDPTSSSSSLITNSSASVARVLVQPNDFSTETEWDGFTIRYGYLHSAYRNNITGNIARINTANIGNAGGAGAYLMEKGVLENCELLHNAILVDPASSNLTQVQETTSGGFHEAGAGVYITTNTTNGEGGTLRNCVVAENWLLHKFSNSGNPESAWMYGAGVYQNRGIIYNTIIRDNHMQVIQGTASAGNSNGNTNEVLVGAGAFLVDGEFYNNTIVNNFAQSYGTSSHNVHVLIPGIYVYTDITMYNSIVSDNTATPASRTGNVQVYDVPVCAFALTGNTMASRYALNAGRVHVHYSYISITRDATNNLCDTNDSGNTNIYLDNNQGTQLSTNYTSANIYNASDYTLAAGSPCINSGTEDIDNVTIPSVDASYADRVQDCAIDMGAYEYNGAANISPREGTEPHYYYDLNGNRQVETVRKAEYFVTQNGSGNASGDSPANAACATKLQKVLDAAGRYKYQHPRTHVLIQLEALPDSAGYTPTRSTVYSSFATINPRSYSFQVPLGVEIDGGWPTNGDFGIDSEGVLHGRDPINNVTRLSGEYQSGTETVNVYHVVTFTDQVFDVNGQPTGQLMSDSIHTYYPNYTTPVLNHAFDRAKLEGLYIEGGRATGVGEEDQRGGAAVVPSYAHIGDCIVRDNQATTYGGAFYMMPGSVLEGSILENNEAAYGGAVAVAESTTNDSTSLSWALLLNNTISGNTASMRGGGLWFNDNARTWNCVYWLNTGAEQNDISGVTSTSDEQNMVNCPVNFCAVTNQTLPGNNNISLSPNDARGTRWGKDTNLKQKHNYDFFLPSRASVLTRSGLPYTTMRSILRYLPYVDSLDIAGVARMEYTTADIQLCDTAYDGETLAVKYNYNMEIGARALNESFSVTIDPDHPLYRLFVAHPEHMDADHANVLMASGDPVYSQQGSSFANPFLRLTDALNYVVDARKNYPGISRNQRFEVFIAEGTYQPVADIMGQQENVRSHTFVIPEKVSLFGGIDATEEDHLYCQDNTNGDKITISSGDSTVTLIGASTDSIRLARERYDLNQNSVVEPWEMQHSSVLSGYAEGSDLTVRNVYHVITSIADTTVVGEMPDMYSDNANKVITTERTKESHYSRGARAIILDGITVTEGSATDYAGSSVRNHNLYFRGGGVFIDGFKLYSQSSLNNVVDMRQGERDIPLAISNSLFQNNQARLGGAIFTNGTTHIVGSSFVQNLAESPSATDSLDLRYVTFSGGGAIASNDTLVISNSIFANNEARDGGGTIYIQRGSTSASSSFTDPTGGKPINISANGSDANDLRGHGGVIWAGDSAAIRLINCDFVRNKAHSYASIYNCTPNTSISGSGHPHFGVNCIFWGNDVDEGKDSLLMNYGDTRVGALYFSAYEHGHGMDATINDTIPTTTFQEADISSYNDLYYLDELLGGANHNVILNSDNDAVDGPNFVLPSDEAGIDGYLQSADWVPSRVNGLTDAGWGMIEQDSTGVFKRLNTSYTGNGGWLVHGVYGWLSDFYAREFNLTMLPMGTDKYMAYADESGDEGSRNMDRISSDPIGNVTKDYIDIGVYEYQHTLLHIADGDEVDELWVSDSENTGEGNDGRSYDSPTSDLQRAIQTLLLSRNDHPKVIHMMEGTYSPVYELDNGNIGFQIHNVPNASSVALRDTIRTGHGYQATSLTILGGYSKTIEGLRDVRQYPTILQMNRRDYASDANTAHLFYIGDAEQWETSGSISGQSGDITLSNNVTKTSVSHGKAMPIVFDGLTFINRHATANHRDLDDNGSGVAAPFNGSATAGAAIYYREQFKSTETSIVEGNNSTPAKSLADHLDPTSNAPKLTIRNCIFRQNGAEGTGASTVPAVFIGRGGGRTLVYNSLFNENAGAPIVSADSLDIVNCTFARNGGHITVKGAGLSTSTINNSLIWRDDSASTQAMQYEGFVADSLHNNAITGVSNIDETANNHNVNLSDANASPMEGPNFMAVTGTDVSTHDYRLNPGMRTMGRGDYNLYLRHIAVIRQGVTDSIGRIVLAPDTTWRYDLQHGVRLYGGSLERGAYECRTEQQRVLYVIPTKTVGTMTGTSWENAYGQGQLQAAIDAAAIYSYTERSEGNDSTSMAYVLVKGEANTTSTESAISMRDGVSVFGSIPDNYLLNISTTGAADNDTLNTYIRNMLDVRPGFAARSTRRSRIEGVLTPDADYSHGSLLDGFDIHSASTLIAPVVSLTQPVVIRNSMIRDNIVTASGQPVINVSQGLLYNVLACGNTPPSGQSIVELGKHGAIVNSTIASETSGETVVSGEGFIANSETYNEPDRSTARGNALVTDSVNTLNGVPFAPYLRANTNPYALSSYITGYRPYHYQLHESSYGIGTGDELDGILTVARAAQGSESTGPYSVINMAKEKGWIDFDNDRDLLGNNRRLGQKVDRGCFETWRVRAGDHITATADRYPHEGSVVYIFDGGSLSLGEDQTTQIFTRDNPFRPAFLLIRQGASLYGNGNIIMLSYVAAEMTLPASQKHVLMSMPFSYKVGEAMRTTIYSNNEIHAEPFKFAGAQVYDGSRRAAWNYHFSEDDSQCWVAMDTTQVMAANTGWLATIPDSIDHELTLRFVGYGEVDGDYVYTENGSSKTVTLTQYDNRPTDGSAHFTKAENMGWNLAGLPFLVGSYPLGSDDDDATSYPMNVPHVIYHLNDDDTYSTIQSWQPDAVLNGGHAFFTQTAVNGSSETLTFQLPVYNGGSSTTTLAKPALMLTTSEGEAYDNIQLSPSEDAKTLQYSLGSDGVKWMPMNDSKPAIYALTADGTPLSLSSATPEGVDIPVEVRMSSASPASIALSDVEAFSGAGHVWLTDKSTGTVTDLMQEAYQLPVSTSLESTASTTRSFTLNIGGMNPNGNRTVSSSVRIWISGRTVHVDGLRNGDTVSIYTISGQLYSREKTDGESYTHDLSRGVYIVRAGGKGQAVAVK